MHLKDAALPASNQDFRGQVAAKCVYNLSAQFLGNDCDIVHYLLNGSGPYWK